MVSGRRPSLYFRVCWLVATPALLLALWVASMVDYTPPSYRQYQYPTWAQVLGWIIASLSLLCIPVYAIFVVIGSPGNNWREVNWRFIFLIGIGAICYGSSGGTSKHLARHLNTIVWLAYVRTCTLILEIFVSIIIYFCTLHIKGQIQMSRSHLMKHNCTKIIYNNT